LKVPAAFGVPLKISWFVGDPKKVAITPAGRFVGAPIPVAPVVFRIIFGSGVFIHRVGLLEGDPAVLIFTVMVPVALTVPQPPVKGIL
jgi:hypothetical protein